jgi:hypothetical protein
MITNGTKARTLVGSLVFLAAGTVHADPVPLVAVTTNDASVAPARIAAAAQVLGNEARFGPRFTETLDAQFGRLLPEGDVLLALRREIAAAAEHYYRDPREARRRLRFAAAQMDASLDAFDTHPENHASYTHALAVMARIARDAHQHQEAEGYFRRIAELDPIWTPGIEEFPPNFIAHYRQVRAAFLALPRGEIVVQTPDEGCRVHVDSREVGASRVVSATHSVGTHRVTAHCGASVSRVRRVEVVPGGRLVIAVDPRLDSALDLGGGLTLRYPTNADVERYMPRDLAALGSVLGVTRIVAVMATRFDVVDVASARIAATVPDAQVAELAGRVRAPLPDQVPPETRDRSPRGSTAANATVRTARRGGTGAAPWVLVGVGGATLVAATVLYLLGSRMLSDLAGTCRPYRDSYICPESAGERHDTVLGIGTASAIAFTAGGVTVAGGVVWFLLGRGNPGVTQPTVQALAAPGGAWIGVRGGF